MKKKILGAAIGSCVHVGGLHHFLELAKAEGYEAQSLGPAVSIESLIVAVEKERPDILAVSYRLTPEVAAALFKALEDALKEKNLLDIRLIFGGTPPAAEAAAQSGLFERVFNDQDTQAEITAYLRGEEKAGGATAYASDLLGRIRQTYPYPLLRHHFGRPTLEETIAGVVNIAEARILDVISLGPDQNAQEHFFQPGKMDHSQDGAGGVPLRKAEDLASIYEHSRCGNFPLVRCYSGTRDLISWAEMSVATIKNAWAAIPLTWYNVMDGRSQLPLKESITEKQDAMRWYAERGIPVEVNEAHQWSLREAHDALAVTMAFLAAYNAKKMGIRHFIAQYMFNTPPGTTPTMDIAKMMAKRELIESLEDPSFTAYREVRAGIAHFSSIPTIAQGQLASSAVISLVLEPHILHVVGYSEGDHAAYPEEVIHSCNIVHGVLKNCLEGFPDLKLDPKVQARKDALVNQAKILLKALSDLGREAGPDPWTHPGLLAYAIKEGFLDTPHFKGNPHLCGKIHTRLINGAWYAWDPESERILTERERTKALLNKTAPYREAEEK